MRAVFFGLSALERNTNLMSSLLLIGMIVSLHGILGPFRKKAQKIQELLFLLNLNALFVMSLYTTSNAIAAQVLILIAVIQITFILFKNQRFMLPIVSAMAKIKTYFSKTKNKLKERVQFELQVIPEVTFNYFKNHSLDMITDHFCASRVNCIM